MIFYEDENWEFAPAEFANLIKFGTENKVALDGLENPLKITWSPETSLVIELNDEGILKYFSEQIAPSVETASQNVVITQDEAGAISFEGTAVDGLELDEQTLKSSLELAMIDGIDSVTATATAVKGVVEVPQELQDKGNAILAILKTKDFDAEVLIGDFDELQNLGQDLQDKLNELMGGSEDMPWEQGPQQFKQVQMPSTVSRYLPKKTIEVKQAVQQPMQQQTNVIVQ